MIHQAYTRIVIQRPNGKTEIVGRKGLHDLNTAVAAFEMKGAGKVVAVRHETAPIDEKTKRRKARAMTLAIHKPRGTR